ncbi:MAG: YlxR family protein [Propionibacteriaceae bacterium]|jgi:predicted RNA-binding protein YlxR (DUF448 family)|nr:YlxR family protein [Propionibacteriaceae bacterium]
MVASPIRSCVGCRQRAPQSLLRRAVAADGSLVFSRQASGRGAWIHPVEACLVKAQRSRAWSRALRASLTPPSIDQLVQVLAIDQADQINSPAVVPASGQI